VVGEIVAARVERDDAVAVVEDGGELGPGAGEIGVAVDEDDERGAGGAGGDVVDFHVADGGGVFVGEGGGVRSGGAGGQREGEDSGKGALHGMGSVSWGTVSW
jgi:hypothetical protein